MWTYVLGPVLSLLPQRWRARWFAGAPADWVRATQISGFVQAAGCLLILIGWYLFTIQTRTNEQLDVTMQATKGVPGQGAGMAIGFASLVVFALDPRTWLLAYLSVEGVVRFFAATLSEEAPGTGPLVLLDWLLRTRQERAYARRVPLLPDRVTFAAEGRNKPQWDVKVETCRPKSTWKYPLTVRYKEEYFQVHSEAHDEKVQFRTDGLPVRPHTYFLRRVPAGEAYRGVVDYDPNEVMQAKAPSLGAVAVGALKDGLRLKTLPLVADDVRRAVETEGVFLCVASCRPKEDWTVGRTVKFEGCYYRMDGTLDLQAPRPFGYRLRLLPAGVPGRAVILYDPNEVLRKPQ
jgi:hypothetical protein